MDSADFYKKMLDNIYEGVYFVDRDRKITFWNKGAERITGFSADQVVGKFCFDNILNHVDDAGTKLCLSGCPLKATVGDGQQRDTKVYLQHKDGHRVAINVRTTPLIEGDKIIGAVEMFINYSDDFLNHYKIEELKNLAYRDQLTGIANRTYLDKEIKSKIMYSESSGQLFGLALIDIDFFKKVNDTYGHLIGDQILKMLSTTLSQNIRATDTAGRWGGEEFVTIFNHVNLENLRNICEKLRILTENSSYRSDDENVNVTISIGATLFKKGDTMNSILERADSLLYESKKNGRNRVTVD